MSKFELTVILTQAYHKADNCPIIAGLLWTIEELIDHTDEDVYTKPILSYEAIQSALNEAKNQNPEG